MASIEDVKAAILDVPDFPKEGIVFKDITPVLGDPALFGAVTDAFAAHYASAGAETIVGVESRGFIFGAHLAHKMGIGLTLVRKPGKLPRKTFSETYSLEYGEDSLEVHEDAFASKKKAIVIDDVLATGGTAAATLALCTKAGAEVVGVGFLMELGFLEGRGKLGDVDVCSLITY